MFMKTNILLIFFTIAMVNGQFPVELNPDEMTDPILFNSNTDTEYLLTLIASANTNWSWSDKESATLTVIIDGNYGNYNQDIVLYSGEEMHSYYTSLGPITPGEHSIQFHFDYVKSSQWADLVQIESIELTDIGTIDVDEDVFRYSPILYGRDILAWNESTRTDIPLIMWHEIYMEGSNKRITYSIIFSNEDSRVGIGLAELMYNYGRTTDIEWVYEVLLDSNGNILSEIFQGASHTTTVFEGNKIGNHPILKNATLNCNFTDVGISDYKFFLSPIFTADENHTREILMDENPWTYRIMAEELIREERYEDPPDPETTEISDVRNYLYIEWKGYVDGQNTTLEIAVNFLGNCDEYVHHHHELEFGFNYNGGLERTSIELPPNFDLADIHQLGFISTGSWDYNMYILPISRFFYLDEQFNPVEIDIDLYPLPLSYVNPEEWITINENELNLDCFGIENGNAQCDDCGLCNGGNADMDDCGICFGNNANMDCGGTCFGNYNEDQCGVCDTDPENDNSTCSGCTDINAENFDEEAIFYDDSCEYSDNIFQVPLEYSSIQSAINFAGDGDIVDVGIGTYNENIDFMGKAINLKSQYENGTPISEFIISGVDSISTVTIENVAGNNSEIRGFTITNGYGRGVSFEDFISMAADPEAFDSLITQVLRGGGISVVNSSPLLKDLLVTNNTSRNVGAGIGLVNSNSIVESVQISDNIIPDGDALGGGGIAVNGGHPFLTGVTIENNIVGSNMYSLNGGGGILCGFSFGGEALQLDVENSKIIGNSANIGAGFGALSGNISFDKVVISNNMGDFGSAISMGEPLGLAINDINLTITNSTIAQNAGLLGVAMINSAYLSAVNSIFWDNGETEFSPLPNNDQLNVSMNFSDAEDEWQGEGNININPLFTSNSDFTLQPNSPCIDAGTNDINFDDIPDIENYSGSAPDMGAYEFEEGECGLTGDVNTDGTINILDIINVVNLILSNQYETCADLNDDSSINILDIVLIVNLILG